MPSFQQVISFIAVCGIIFLFAVCVVASLVRDKKNRDPVEVKRPETAKKQKRDSRGRFTK